MRIGDLERRKERFKNPGKRFDCGRRKTMPFMKKTPSSPKSPLRTRRSSWSGELLKNATPLRQVIYAMQIQSKDSNSKSKTVTPDFTAIDRTLLLPDQIIGNILSRLPDSQRDAISTVCRRWLSLRDRLLQSLNLLDWKFLESGRLISRFSNLTYVNLVNASFTRIPYSGVLIRQEMFSVPIDSLFNTNWLFVEENLLSVEIVDRGIRTLASGCPNLRKVALINASELGLLSLAESCPMLQELELHRCNDHLLRGIAAFENLQILRLIGNLDGFYSSSVSDIGLTILAQGCKRLVKLELSDCEGSFDAIKAIGQCCEMIEELSICDHQMDAGWVAALSYFENLKTLKLRSCRKIDTWSGAGEFLGSCPALERLHLNRSLLSDKDSVLAFFRVCEGAREVVFQDCWGLDDATFRLASVFRRVKSLTLEGCSLLTATGLESAILPWEELETLKVVSCKNIKDDEISAALSSLFSLLKELKWMPNRKSQLLSILKSFGVGKRGRRFFKR